MRDGVERAVEEEVFSQLRFATASAEELFRFKVRPAGAGIASVCAKLSEQNQLAT